MVVHEAFCFPPPSPSSYPCCTQTPKLLRIPVVPQLQLCGSDSLLFSYLFIAPPLSHILTSLLNQLGFKVQYSNFSLA